MLMASKLLDAPSYPQDKQHFMTVPRPLMFTVLTTLLLLLRTIFGAYAAC
jgi:hypothetical protein